jgi:hypothetical protein
MAHNQLGVKLVHEKSSSINNLSTNGASNSAGASKAWGMRKKQKKTGHQSDH